MAETGEITVNVHAKDAATGDDIPFAELKTFAIRCGPNQHDYSQGNGVYEHLLFCHNCGDVVLFSLPAEDGA